MLLMDLLLRLTVCYSSKYLLASLYTGMLSASRWMSSGPSSIEAAST